MGELCLLTLQGNDARYGDLCLELTVLEMPSRSSARSKGAAGGRVPDPEADESARLSEQILDALVDEHGRESQDGSVRAWLRKRRGGMRSDGRPGDTIPGRSPMPELSSRPSTQTEREELITSNLGLAHQLARRFLHRGEPSGRPRPGRVGRARQVGRSIRSEVVALTSPRLPPGRSSASSSATSGTRDGPSGRVAECRSSTSNSATPLPRLVQQLGRNPTVAELAEATGASEEAVIEAIEAGQGYRAASIDANESEDDPLSARLGEHDDNYDSVEDRALLGPALATLPPREQSILRMRFVDGLTQSEIAVAVGVSQMHVSRLLSSSLQKLREGIGQTEAGGRSDEFGHITGCRPESVPKTEISRRDRRKSRIYRARP